MAAIVTIGGSAAVLVGARFASDALEGSARLGPSLSELSIGTCGDVGPGGRPVELVDCDEPHRFQVFSRGTIRLTPDITDFDALQAVAQQRCEADLARIVGRSTVDVGTRLDPIYGISRLMQDREGPYSCLIWSVTADPLVGSYTDIDT